jgi:SMC interacting uncharacterized protein involved in chromosome segregation
LEAELTALRSVYQSINPEEAKKLEQTRRQLQQTFAKLQQECEEADKQIRYARDRIALLRQNPQARELEAEFSDLLKEERLWNAKRQIKVDEKKDGLKSETKKQLSAMISKKKMMEGDLQAFQSAVIRLKDLRTEMAKSPRKGKPASGPDDCEDLNNRITEVSKEVRGLEAKCRTLREFVALRAPERYKQIVFDDDEDIEFSLEEDCIAAI